MALVHIIATMVLDTIVAYYSFGRPADVNARDVT
jgi:hypothetical protein